MSESYDNTNRGQIWKNDAIKSDKHPQFKGSLNVDGVEYWVSAWTRKEGANPKAPALTFSIAKKEDKVAEVSADTVSADTVAQDGFDDAIPF